jgi:hypothetical protein
MERYSLSPVKLVLLAGIAVLTLSAAYIHFNVGGILLLLNAAGAVGLLSLLIVSYAVVRQARPLILLALAAYSAGSIVGWAMMGPYFDLAYLTKGIELVLIGLIGIELWGSRAEIRPAFVWLRSLSATMLSSARRADQEELAPQPDAAEE